MHRDVRRPLQLSVLCLGNRLHAPLRKKCGKFLYFPPYTVIPLYTTIQFWDNFHPTLLFRPKQLLIWMNFPPYTIIPHCPAIRHFTVDRYVVSETSEVN